jgi:hypothetical protein
MLPPSPCKPPEGVSNGCAVKRIIMTGEG